MYISGFAEHAVSKPNYNVINQTLSYRFLDSFASVLQPYSPSFNYFFVKSSFPDIKRIAISTGGGDAPGLNAVIKSVVLSASMRGWECIGIRDGYDGLLFPDRYVRGGHQLLRHGDVQYITPLGGTILGSTNRGNPFEYPEKQPDGTIVNIDMTQHLLQALKDLKIDAVVAVGGDGSLNIANELGKLGVRIIGVPKTIDNDLEKTSVTFGFDTAVAFATECIDRLHTTARSHGRMMVVEVMGRYAGWIALHSGISASADAILIPEIPYDINKVADYLMKNVYPSKQYAIIVVAEGALPEGGEPIYQGKDGGKSKRLGGAGERVAKGLSDLTGVEVRDVVLGHLLRGGSPTAFDRLISLRFGAAATRGLAEGRTQVMVSIDPPNIEYVPLELVAKRMKRVDIMSDTVITARELGICFGD